MTTTPLATDTTGDKIANARKAIGAGVSAAFAAAVPLLGTALVDGTVDGTEAGGIAAAFAGALVTVTYVTWQTVNRPKPTDVAALANAVAAVPPIVVQAVPADQVTYVGPPVLPTEPGVDDGPAHRAS